MANRATKLIMDRVTDKIRESCFTRANNYTLENGETWCKGTEYPSGSYGHRYSPVARCAPAGSATGSIRKTPASNIFTELKTALQSGCCF